MNRPFRWPDRSRIRHVGPAVFIGLIWMVLVLVPVGDRGLWAPDEPRYVQVAWSMERTGSWIVPVINGEVYSHKPPLFFWLTSLTAKLTGYETSSRYVTAFAVLGLIILVYRLGAMSGRGDTGMTAALVLMSSGLFTWLMGTGNMDILLALWVTWACYAFLQYLRSGKRRWIISAYVACGLGVLTKGPVGLLLPYLVFLAWTWLEKRTPKRKTPPSGHLAWGPLITLAVAAAWVVPACTIGGAEYARAILLKQNIGRAVASFAHRKPFYFYITQLPVLLLPWSVVLAGLIPELRRRWREGNEMVRFCLIWALVVLVFFSFVSGKRGRYMIPSYPAWALLTAISLGETQRRSTRRALTIAGILVMVAASLVAITPLIAPLAGEMIRREGLPRVDTMGLRRFSAFVVAAAGVFLARLATEKKRPQAMRLRASALALGVLCILGSVHVWFVHYIDPVKSARKMAQRIRSEIGEKGKIAIVGSRFDGGLNLYLQRVKIPVVDIDSLGDEHGWDLLVVREKDYKKLVNTFGEESWMEVTAARTGSHHFRLLRPSSRP